MKLSLGDRMKSYEDVTRYVLPHKSFVLARIDGRAFHTYTRGLKRPFDEELIEDMDQTAIELCKQIQNAKFAFVQSDEINVLIHETEQDSEPWFDSNIQKMSSIAASIATGEFNRRRIMRALFEDYCSQPRGEEKAEKLFSKLKDTRQAHFDARFWTIPTVNEVVNYFMWRQQDATKNSISAVAQANFSHKRLENVNSNQKQEMLWAEKGINWNDFPVGQKRGRFIERVSYEIEATCSRKPGEVLINPATSEPWGVENLWAEPKFVVRSKWAVVEPPIFSQDKEFLLDRIKVNY